MPLPSRQIPFHVRFATYSHRNHRFKAGCKKIFREKVSGVGPHRPEVQRMLDQVRAGDTIVVWKLDRLARSSRDLLETMETIRQAGEKFQSLSEPWADTTTHAGKMIMTIFGGI